jgi:1-acyl-sn-glycerol-3-phosphate acyltransferase
MNALYEIGKLLSHCTFDGIYPGDVAGVQNIPRCGPFIVACNHASFFDPPAVGRLVPREIAYFARKTLFKPGPVEKVLNRVNAIPVDRDGESDIQAIKKVLHALKHGQGVLFFPEGTRSPDGALQPPKQGLGMIACRAGVPVVPARIFGSYESYGRGRTIPAAGGSISVAFAPALRTKNIDPGPGTKNRYEIASRRIMDAIATIPAPSAPGI